MTNARFLSKALHHGRINNGWTRVYLSPWGFKNQECCAIEEIRDFAERCGFTVNRVVFDQLKALMIRYGRYCHYCREIEPEWKDVRVLAFADNSEELEQINKYGKTRRIMLAGPHGDLCY